MVKRNKPSITQDPKECDECNKMRIHPEDCDHREYTIGWEMNRTRSPKSAEYLYWCTRCGSTLFVHEPHCDECRSFSDNLWQPPGECWVHQTHIHVQEPGLTDAPETPEMKALRLSIKSDESLVDWLGRLKREFK